MGALGALLLSLQRCVATGAVAATLTTAGSALAQEPQAGVVLVVESLPPNLDAEQARAAIARELGTTVTLSREGAQGPNTLTLRAGEGKRVVLSHRGSDGRVTEREIDLPDPPDRAAEVTALLAGAVVRDRAGEQAAAPATAPATAAAPSPPSEKPVVAQEGLCSREGTPLVPVGIDFLPFVGSSTVAPNTARRFSLNILGGYSAGLLGFELGSIANINTKFTCGVQVGGVANVTVGPVRGAQIGGVANVALGPVRGAQVGGVMNIAGGDTTGAQIAGVMNLATGNTVGAQVGVVNVATGDVRGAQIGVVNVATGDVHGAQIGLVSIAPKGRTHLDFWGQESGLLMLGVKHGSKYVHNIYGVGVLPFGDKTRLAAAVGIGGHFSLSERWFLDTDMILYSVFDPEAVGKDIKAFASEPLVYQNRVTAGVRLTDDFAVYAGPTANVSVSDNGVAKVSPYNVNWTDRGKTQTVQAWPGLVVGVQAF